MPSPTFAEECDRLSRTVDPVQFERLRWARTEGPMLEHLVALTQATVAERPDLELTEEGSAGNIRRFVLKVHGFRIVALRVAVDAAGHVTVGAEAIERSRYRLTDEVRSEAAFGDVDQAWMEAAFEQAFCRVARQP